MKTVTVYGEDIDFPDEMSDTDIETAISNLIASGQIKSPESTSNEIKAPESKEKFDFIKVLTELGKGLKEGTVKNLKQVGADIATTEYQFPSASSALMGGLGGYYPNDFDNVKSVEEAKDYRNKIQSQIEKSTTEPTSTSGKVGYNVSKFIVPGSAGELGLDVALAALTAGVAPGLSAAAKSRKLSKGFKPVIQNAEKTPGFAEMIKTLAKKGYKTGKTLAKGGAYLGGLKLLFDNKEGD